MAYFQEDVSIRYITHVDDDTSDSESKLTDSSGTVNASFYEGGGVGLHIYGTDRKERVTLTLDQAKHLVGVILDIEKIHLANQKTKGE